jgi:CPA2 family monovalent cation:H+ antiporter-2
LNSVLIQVLIYLVAAVVAVPLARWSGLGSVLGYLIAGLVIGPVLHLAGSETEAIQQFAEFGVVLMLFLIGLELQPRALWQMRGRLLGLGGLQVALTVLVVAAAAMAVGLDWHLALMAGMILCLSSTAIVMQTLQEKKLAGTEGGQASFAVLLFQDLAALPFLALIPLLALAGSAPPPVEVQPIHLLPEWMHPVAIAGAVALVVFGGRYLVRPAFAYFSLARMREVQVAAALLIVIAVSVMMDEIGLSPALGSFLAGVVLASSEYRHEIQSDIAPFKGLLLGLFFITVGASMDLGLLVAEPGRFLGYVLLLIVVKMLVLYPLAWVFGLRGRDRMLFTFALAQAGEFGFFLAAFAAQARVLDAEQTSRVLLVVSLSMFLTPALFVIQDRLSRRDDGQAGPDEPIDARGQVIIAGYGRFGRTIGRMLRVAGHEAVVIDSEPKVVGSMRARGVKAYYGEVERPDLLEAAGIAQAQALVIAIDDRGKSLALARFVRKAYPQVRIVARARDQQHVLEYADLGVIESVREVFDGAVLAGRHALTALGHDEGEIELVARAFEARDRELREELAQVWDRKLPLEHDPALAERMKAADAGIEARLRSEPDPV